MALTIPEVRRLLNEHMSPSFDRNTVEGLLDEIERLSKSNVEPQEAVGRAEKAERERDEARGEVIAADADRSAAKTAQALCVRRAEASEAEVARLREAGAGMANILYNLAQSSALPDDLKIIMKEAQVHWDAARAALQGEPE